MENFKFIFYGKILGLYYELDESNTKALENSKIKPASTQKWFMENARKAYPDYKLVFNKVG